MLSDKDMRKLDDIWISYHNGQKKQMVEQIKKYGVRKFMIDFYGFCRSGIPSDKYGVIVYTYFLLTQ